MKFPANPLTLIPSPVKGEEGEPFREEM